MICDWCGTKYAETLQNKKSFHMLENYVHKPIICKVCYKQIKSRNCPKSKMDRSLMLH
jgi:hypothetical protein